MTKPKSSIFRSFPKSSFARCCRKAQSRGSIKRKYYTILMWPDASKSCRAPVSVREGLFSLFNSQQLARFLPSKRALRVLKKAFPFGELSFSSLLMRSCSIFTSFSGDRCFRKHSRTCSVVFSNKRPLIRYVYRSKVREWRSPTFGASRFLRYQD